MERIIFEVNFKDGRMFRIFCENSTQKTKALKSFNDIKDKITGVKSILNGIHKQKEWNKIVNTL